MGAQIIPVACVVALAVATLGLVLRGVRPSRGRDGGASDAVLGDSWAICGEYLSAASFLGIAGLVMKFGYDALWYAAGFAGGWVLLLVFVAGPWRRSGAATVADFAETRLGGTGVRGVATLFSLCVALVLMLAQLKAAGVTVAYLVGAPYWVGVVGLGAVAAAGLMPGMAGLTPAAAFQYWVKLFAVAAPVLVLAAFTGSGYGATVAAGARLLEPFGQLAAGHGHGEHSLLYTYSLAVALVCGAAGLPHVLPRLRRSANARHAKRTALAVVGSLSLFYVFPGVWGAMGRVFAPSIAASGGADLVTLQLPAAVLGSEGSPFAAQVLSGVTSAGAFAAFGTAFAALVAYSSRALAQELRGRGRATAPAGAAAYRVAVAATAVVAAALGLAVREFDIAVLAGWAFAIAASTCFPLLALGSWYRGLTKAGAIAGMLAGGTGAVGSVVFSMLVEKGIAAAPAPLVGTLAWQPAIWTVPLAFALMCVVSMLTKDLVPADVRLRMLQLHAPEQLGLGRLTEEPPAVRTDG